jgi:hypothetical protein
MKTHIQSLGQKSSWIGVATLCASAFAAQAGELQTDSKETKAITPPESAELWHFDMALPGWLAATSGTVGLNGTNSRVYLGADSLIRHLDMVASVSAEARYGRFGIYGDYMYVSAAGRAFQDGILQKVDVHLNETLSNLEGSYRVIDGERGFLAVRAGVRFTSIYNNVTLHGNDDAIDAAAANLVDATSAKINSFLKDELRSVIEGREPVLPVAPLTADEKEKLQRLITAAQNNPRLVEAIKIRNAAQIAAINAEVAAVTADLRARAAAAQAAFQAAQAQVDQAKNNVQQKIAAELKKELNSSPSLQEYWFDPYVGFQARYNLSKAFYLTAKSDVGGFGVGSLLTFQASGALGCQLSRYIYTEIGYHYLYTNYRNNSFIYDVNMQGAELTMGIRF